MNWQIDIPYNDRGDLVLDAITAAKQEFGADDQRTQIVEVLARDALHNRGITTIDALLDELGGLDQAQVRARLDEARSKLGLPSTGEVDKRREDFRFEAAFRRLQPPPPPKWSPLQSCHAPDCPALPVNEAGALREVTVERWFCPRHRDLAQPGDLERHEPAIIALSGTGAPIYSEKERRRRAEWAKQRDQKQERERRQREELRAAEADAIEEAKQRYADEGEISVLGVRTRPDLRIIE
ncbi:MAG: hypothetical protein ACXWDP_05640 [Solirubrobacterales bacterium]